MPYTRDQLDAGRLVWVLTLTLRGQLYRFSTAAVDVDLEDGAVLHFAPGLTDLEFEDRLALPGEGLEEPSISLEVFFAADTVSGWAALAAGDLDLGDAAGELALLLEGALWETREIVLSGPLSASSYGAPWEPVTLTLSEAPWRGASRRLPADSEVVTADTWPRASATGYSLEEGVEGVRYPEVVGAPGYRHPRDTSTSYPAVPVALVEIKGGNNSVDAWVGLIGRGRLSCVGVADSVRVRNLDGGVGANFTPEAIQDGLGQTVTVVTIPGATLAVNAGEELWASFLLPASGGRANPFGEGTLRRAGDVLATYLIESGVRVDVLALEAARAALNGAVLDAYWNEQVDPLDVVLDDLLPLLPAVLHVGPGGLRVVPWPWRATPADAVAHLDVDKEGGARDGPVERSSPEEVVNHLAIEFAYQGGNQDAHQGRLVYLPSRRYSDSEQERNPYAAASASRYGEREADPVVTDLVVDPATARGVLDWQIRWRGQTRETVRFILGQGRQALQLGQVVTVSCEEIAWESRLCAVTARVRAPGPAVVEVTTLPDWMRDGLS